ncbi:uncharacterized protein [Apostichopus japonicus]|uniref:uncharacterized protein n=1 Tax=Stichopus japonicus TaxID=307972 RepID=UPI003AB214CA
MSTSMEEGQIQATNKSKNKSKDNGTKTKGEDGKDYKAITPMQQKDRKIQELRKKIKSLEGELTDKESDHRELNQQNQQLNDKLKDLDDKLTAMDKQHDDVTTKLEKLTEHTEDVESTLQDKIARISEMESKLAQVTDDQNQREKIHQRRYLELYQKGQEAVLIEQEEELVRRFAMEKGDPLTQKLVEKLSRTERKLQKMKDSKREETYKKGPNVASIDDAKIGMLKSAVFYYLTGREKEGNLEMIMTLLEFSETHRELINHAVKDKKAK